MKKYIGTQQVDAESMTMEEAYKRKKKKKNKVPNDSEKDNPGFYVKYQDDYESWLPAETFCKIYKIAETPLERMIIEYQELRNKIDNLKNSLNYKMQILIEMQHRVMIEYSLILKERIENM